MGLFKKLAGLLGLGKDEEEQHDDVSADGNSPFASSSSATAAPIPVQHLPRKGFSVPVQVPVERGPPPPLFQFFPAGDGGLQVSDERRGTEIEMTGLGWYARRLGMDDDGDVADKFLDEIVGDASTTHMEEDNKSPPKFEVNYRTKPAKVINQALLSNGRIQQQVVYQGRSEWV